MNKQLFKQNPSLDSYFETSDGNKFYKEHDAKAYAKKLKDKKVKEVLRPDADEDDNDGSDGGAKSSKKAATNNVKLSADQRIEAIEKMTAVADIEEALKGEKAKTVLAAGDKRIAEINATDALDKKEDPNVTTK